MEKTLFDRLIGETYATYGKPTPRQSVLDAAFKFVADFPDEFILWAAEQMQDADRLPPNIGRTLKKDLFPAWRASQMPTFTNEQYYADMCGDPDCPECRGKGWFYVWKRGAKPGTAPTAIPCLCNLTCDAFPDMEIRKASLADLKANGWTFHEPPRIRNRPPQPLKKSLQEMLDGLHAGRGIPADAFDPRRQMPEEYE